MKKNHKLLLSAVSILALFASCAKENPIEAPSAVPATISVAIPEEGFTKVALTQDADPDGAVKLTWESTDVITVKDAADESKSVDFSYKSGAGTASAEFSAKDISALVGASSYNIYLTSNLPGGFNNQTQASNGSTAHLGYSAKLSGVNKYDGATFSQTWATANGGGTLTSSSVLRIRANMPTADIADAVRKVTVKASEEIFDGSDELSITITTPGVDGDGTVVTVYATLPAGDVDIAADTELLFQFQVSADANDKYTAYRKLASATTLSSGQVNFFKINCPDIESYAGPDDAGTSSKPYLIGDRHQLDKMRDLLESGERIYFQMVDDVDLDGIDWEPVATGGDDNFQIDFGGGGHTIFNLKVDAVSGAAVSSDYAGFFSFLWGEVHDVIFDGADISAGAIYAGVVAGYIGVSSHAGVCKNVTVCNSTVSCGSYAGGIGGRVRKGSGFSGCNVINTEVTTTAERVGGLFGLFDPNSGGSIYDCSAEGVTITGANYYGGGLLGLIAVDNVNITRCHTSGLVKTSGSGRHYGGLIGSIQASNVSISNCYSTCTVNSYLWGGGLIGSIWSGSGIEVEHCFASGNVTFNKGLGGDAGLSGAVQVSGVTISNCIAWNGTITPKAYAVGNYSSGAVVGHTHPNCILTDNYRNPDMALTAYWVPSVSYDHPNVNGTTTPLVRIGTDLDESNAAATDLTAFDSDHGRWAYHGKHCESGTTVTPDNSLGWVSDDIGDGTDPEEAAGWTDTPSLDLETIGGTTVVLRTGVEWTTFHGMWEGEIRNINVVRTTLNGSNHLGIYYNYSDDGYMYLDEKCEYVGALAGTNGPMKCCHFVRVDDVVKRPAISIDAYYKANCALTIDGDEVNIVKVANNYAAAALSNRNVGCAGPLLVWKGNIQTYPEEGTSEFLDTTHPRTAIGISKDGLTVVQVTVDGRWDQSADEERAIGMSTALLSELMRQLGCYKAMNFDGGGGTAMWIDGYGNSRNIVNHVSENRWDWNGTVLRATGNAVYVK